MSAQSVITDAIVLSSGNYLESSKLLNLFTRELGVVSVVARGARSSSKRFGSALQVFAEGEAMIQVKSGRDLSTLVGFDVVTVHAGIADDLDRFWAASAIAEIVRHLIHDETSPTAYDRLSEAMAKLELAQGLEVASLALATLWQLVADAGFEPALEHCAECRSELDTKGTGALAFQHAAGGILCERCARLIPGGRLLPPAARRTLIAWLAGEEDVVDKPNARAHQSLLLGFLQQHVQVSHHTQAFEMWQNSLK